MLFSVQTKASLVPAAILRTGAFPKLKRYTAKWAKDHWVQPTDYKGKNKCSVYLCFRAYLISSVDLCARVKQPEADVRYVFLNCWTHFFLKQSLCASLDENGPHRLMFEYLVPN